MSGIDWAIVAAFMVFITLVAVTAKKYTRSVADFLAANRCAGKYLLAVGDGISGLGAISVLAQFQMFYESGFTKIWWESAISALTIFVAVTGWVTYRFRQTRALTMGQFLEMRYSRNFRIFAGILVFVSGVINFGIFPAVGTRFAIYYCNLPDSFAFLGLELDTYPVLMASLIALAYGFTFVGGYIAVLLTDFAQGVFTQVVFLIVLAVFLLKFDWSDIVTTLSMTPENQSRSNPFSIGQHENYDMIFWLIIFFQVFYAVLGWQGQQAYNSSAKNPHEAKMSKALGHLRVTTPWVFMAVVSLCAYALFNNPIFSGELAPIEAVLSGIENEQVQSQMRVPLVLRSILPIGVLGLFCAAMLAAFVSTHDTYMHSWGCIFIQDIVLPLRGRPFTPEQHIRYLRLAILGVCVFIFFFSWLFEQRSDIYMFMALTGAIFLGGSGAIIIGGLYWKRATTAGAWTAMIVCAVMATTSFALENFWGSISGTVEWVSPWLWSRLLEAAPALAGEKFIFSPQEMYFFNMISSSVGFVVVSLLTCKKDHDMDRLLHRGEHTVASDVSPKDSVSIPTWKKALGFQPNLALDDKAIFVVMYAFLFFSLGSVIFGSIYHGLVGISDEVWISYWRVWLWVFLAFSIGLTVWLAIGGGLDVREMLRTLSTLKRDHSDTGIVGPPDDPAPPKKR